MGYHLTSLFFSLLFYKMRIITVLIGLVGGLNEIMMIKALRAVPGAELVLPEGSCYQLSRAGVGSSPSIQA